MQKISGGLTLRLEKDDGWDSTILRLRRVPENVAKAIEKELIYTGMHIRNVIVRSMQQTPKTGRRYRKTKNKNIYHIASSPGYPPARDTGDLVKSIKVDVRKGVQLEDIEVEVGSNMTGKHGKYPQFLEFGTGEMDARPWLEPAFIRGQALFYATVRRNVQRAIKKL